jgi:hypothetical protein
MTANLAKEVKLYQQQSYNLTSVPLICKYYEEEILVIGAEIQEDPEKLMEMSYKILPKAGSQPTLAATEKKEEAPPVVNNNAS